MLVYNAHTSTVYYSDWVHIAGTTGNKEMDQQFLLRLDLENNPHYQVQNAYYHKCTCLAIR